MAVESAERRLLARLWQHFSRRRRSQFLLLFGLVLLSALAEAVTLGAVLPFIGVLTAPDKVFALPVVGAVIRGWGITSAERLVLPLTIAFASAALLAGAIRMLVLWLSTRLAFAAGADISSQVYRRTLYQPYSVHVTRNSSDVISGITQQVAGVVEVLNQALTLISSLVLLAAIMLALLVIDPVVAAVATLGFGGIYALIAWMFRRRLHRNSQRIAAEQIQVIKALQEGLGGIRDVLLDGTQPVYCDIYRRADLPLRRAQGNNLFIAASPRFVMEAIGMILIAVLAYSFSQRPGGVASVLPVMGALALGAQRLMPVLQQAYNAWATIAGKRASVSGTLALLEQPLPVQAFEAAPQPLRLQNTIGFRALSFRYDAAGPWVLDNVSVTIHKGARVGFVGITGSGKSTLMDLMMGLLVPSSGEVLVDDQPISGARARAWQRAIAHVPQAIYLADATLAENIAFGVPRESIDMERVKRAAWKAQIGEFIESRPEGYAALTGERGIRLSGGQRQRIGIARALYKQASVLVFDEATSALDNATEQSVMDAIEGLDRELTIVLIAHRLTTLRRCDTIVELREARIAAQGTFERLLADSPSFRRIAHAAG